MCHWWVIPDIKKNIVCHHQRYSVNEQPLLPGVGMEPQFFGDQADSLVNMLDNVF